MLNPLSQALQFLILGFSVFRLSVLVTADDGPFELMLKFRNLFLGDNWVARGVRCVYCVSFWIGLAAGVGVAVTSPYESVWSMLAYGLVYGLALSGFAIWVYKK